MSGFRPRTWLFLVVALAGGGGCRGALTNPDSQLRFEEGDRIKVPHAVHKENDIDCISCHEELFDSASLEKRVLPKEEKCLECHEEWKTEGKCSTCHFDVKMAGFRSDAQVQETNFNHVKHIERVAEDCSKCHLQVTQRERKGVKPTMDTCRNCHNHDKDFKAGNCSLCHMDLSRWALRPQTFFRHEADFIRTHRLNARSAGAQCATCHEQNFCADCHATRTTAVPVEVLRPERVDQNFIHRNDFISRHMIEARAEPTTCMRCHGTSYCSSCHTDSNVSPQGTDPRSPHPPGYSFPGSAQFHGPDARRDIISCAACHDQGGASVCIDCHKVGGIGGNPHPPSWALMHDRREIDLNGMCMNCHN